MMNLQSATYTLNSSYNVLLLHYIVVRYVFILNMLFHLMLETLMMTFKLT